MSADATNISKPWILGLTGGIASGKSTVARQFIELGVPVCDADQLARDVVAVGSDGLQQVVAAFGEPALQPNGELDRAWLRSEVFADPSKRQILEGIIHPLVRAGLQQFIQQAAADEQAYAILEVPLLVEGGLDAMCDSVLVVDVPQNVQLERLQARDGSSLTKAKNIIAAQSSRQQRLTKADDVLVNDQEITALRAAVGELHKKYLQAASNHAR